MKKFFLLAGMIVFFSGFVMREKYMNALVLPVFHFKVNSAQLVDSSSYFANKIPSQELLMMVKRNIEEYEEIEVLEVSGHADFDEKNPQALSEKRARMIRETLVKLGIPSERLTAKGYGNTAPLADKQTILTEKDPYHIKLLRQSNRRVSFRVVNEKRK